MTSSEFIEESLFRRLNDKSRDVREVSSYEYEHIMQQLSPLIDRFVARTKVAGMSEDDLKSLYAMKVHQTLRRGFYDRTKKPQIYFWWVLNNLNRDINRLKQVAERKGLDQDASEQSFVITSAFEVSFEREAEIHEFDKIFLRLTENEQKLIKIALGYVERDDHVLVPLAAQIMSVWEE